MPGRERLAPRPSPAPATAPSMTFSITLMCGNRLKAWKTRPSRRRIGTGSMPGIGDRLAVEVDVAVVDLLEQVDAAQQRRLARARGADQRDRLVLADRQVDPAQHLALAVVLRDAAQLEDGGHRRLT